MSDGNDQSFLGEMLETAEDQKGTSKRESARESMAGLRDQVGMNVWVALLIDAIFLALGAWIMVSYPEVGWLGLALIAIGVYGVVEKGYRRVRS